MVKSILDLGRGLVRPIATLFCIGQTAVFIAFQTPIPTEWWAMTLAMVAWWFADRSPIIAKKA